MRIIGRKIGPVNSSCWYDVPQTNRILALFEGRIVSTFNFDTITFNILTHNNTNVTDLTFTHDAWYQETLMSSRHRANIFTYAFIYIGSARGRDRMVPGFTATCVISAYHCKHCDFEPRSLRGALDTALCDKVCQ